MIDMIDLIKENGKKSSLGAFAFKLFFFFPVFNSCFNLFLLFSLHLYMFVYANFRFSLCF